MSAPPGQKVRTAHRIGQVALVIMLAGFGICFGAMAAGDYDLWLTAVLGAAFLAGMTWFFSGHPYDKDFDRYVPRQPPGAR